MPFLNGEPMQENVTTSASGELSVSGIHSPISRFQEWLTDSGLLKR